MSIEIGARYVFAYKGGDPGSCLFKRSGEVVEVVEVVKNASIPDMWKVQFDDGFTHMAWGFELKPAPGIPIREEELVELEEGTRWRYARTNSFVPPYGSRVGAGVKILSSTPRPHGLYDAQDERGDFMYVEVDELARIPGVSPTGDEPASPSPAAASIEAEDQIAYDSDDDQLVDFEIKVEVRPLVEYRIAHAELEGLRALANALHAMSSELEGAGYPNKIYQGAARLSEMIGRISGRRA